VTGSVLSLGPERTLYSISLKFTRDPYPDPHDPNGKNLVADLRAFEKLPRQGGLCGVARESRAEENEIA